MRGIASTANACTPASRSAAIVSGRGARGQEPDQRGAAAQLPDLLGRRRVDLGHDVGGPRVADGGPGRGVELVGDQRAQPGPGLDDDLDALGPESLDDLGHQGHPAFAAPRFTGNSHGSGWSSRDFGTHAGEPSPAVGPALPFCDRVLTPIAGEPIQAGRVRMCGPSSVIATECSQCTARAPSAVTTVQPSSSSRVSGVARGEHRLDRQRHARAQPRALPRLAVVGQERVHVHRRADAVAAVLRDDPVVGAVAQRRLLARALHGVRDVGQPAPAGRSRRSRRAARPRRPPTAPGRPPTPRRPAASPRRRRASRRGWRRSPPR